MSFNPHASVATLKGVGPKVEATLNRLGIFRVLDLLLHLPFRYQDRSKLTPIGEIEANEAFLIQAPIKQCQVVFGKRRSLKVTVQDETGRAHLRFFYFNKYQQANFERAEWVRAYGEFRFFGRELSVAHPEYELFDTEPPIPSAELTPIYPATAGLNQARLRKLLAALVEQPWPKDTGTPYEGLLYLHNPPAHATTAEIEAQQRAIALDELTAYYLVMKGRALQRLATDAIPLPQSQGLGRTLLQALGFTLTDAQKRVAAEVLEDLAKPVPMLRLVQGDVGSGKTVIAAFAAIRAAEQNCQTAVMAPTELLAEQHFFNFSEWLTPLGINTVLLTGHLTAAEARLRLKQIEDGEAHVVIGTHALFQDKVVFARLGLSIIDEQHRFGVHQRMALQGKGDTQPHQLVMTATPIPRTLTMALYADMAVSVIDELPEGRQPITTYTVEANRRDEVVALAAKTIAAGQQVYWVCTLIEDSDEIDAVSAEQAYADLVKALPHTNVGLLHGRMRADEKASTMQAFKAREIDLLVATTVVEVGVDVPNATQMVIENAERLGLAQLHQLRGRIGRGQVASQCYLLFNTPLSQAARTRLTAMRESQDGFYLAEQDLKLRGPGDVLGTRQAGEQSFRIADLNVHQDLIPQAMERGEEMIQRANEDAEVNKTMANLLITWAPTEGGSLSV